MAYDETLNGADSRIDSADRSACGLARAADLIGDRWTMLILREAMFGITRFDDIQERLGCPRSILSGRLRRLVDAGVLTRREYQEPGQRKRRQYVLTKRGVELALPMMALMQWGAKHLLDDAPAFDIVERASGAPARIGVVGANDAPIGVGETTLRKRAQL